jgi:hypothetical protein
MSKSVHTEFTNMNIRQQPMFINGTHVPYTNTVKSLGMTFDAKLQWKEYINKESDELNIKLRKMYWLLACNSELSVHNDSYYTIKLYIQLGVMVSGFGAAQVILKLK